MMNSSLQCFFTNDVETTSIVHGGLSDTTGDKVLREGMPRLLSIYEEYDVKATFFFTGHIAAMFPEVVKMVLPAGHEVACHGWSHCYEDALDLHDEDWQYSEVLRAKKLLEDISGQEVLSFRAPALRTNMYTASALLRAGYRVDSSVASQRFDFGFSTGSVEKLKWMLLPRAPYFVDRNSLLERGATHLMEFPVSALIMPYIGTTMRVFPLLTRGLRAALSLEAAIRGQPVNFLFHPNEILEETENEVGSENVKKNANIISGFLRRRLKLRNLGEPGAHLLMEQLRYFSDRKAQFIRMIDYYNMRHNG